MAKYQSMLVVIDPNQGRPAGAKASGVPAPTDWWTHQSLLPIYDFSYEMTTLLSPDERTAMRQGVIAQRTAWIREQAKFYTGIGRAD